MIDNDIFSGTPGISWVKNEYEKVLQAYIFKCIHMPAKFQVTKSYVKPQTKQNKC